MDLNSKGKIVGRQMFHLEGRTDLAVIRKLALEKSANSRDGSPARVMVHMHKQGDECTDACESYYAGVQE